MNHSVKNIFGLFAWAGLLLVTACFDNNESETIVTDYNNALITKASFNSNSNVCYGLNGYAFTIDNFGNSDQALIDSTRSLWEVDQYSLAPGIIFNVDSLPAGTIADSIKVSLSYASPRKVEFYQYDEELNLQKKTNFADTQIIWFDDYAITRIQVTAQDGLTNKSYFLKVNIHKCTTDTIAWSYLCKDLFDMSDVTDQRVDTIGTTLCWYTTHADNSQLVRTADLTGDLTNWSSPVGITSPASIELGSLFNWNEKLYAVGSDLSLLATTDGVSWSVASSDFAFVNLLGVQLSNQSGKDKFCGIAKQGDEYHFVCSYDGSSWSLDTTLVIDEDTTSLVPADFPLTDYTRPISVAAKPYLGSTKSRIYISGGVKADGTLTSSTWSTDGQQWVEFKQRFLPPTKRSTIIQYTLDVNHPNTFWIMQTGEMADGSVSDALYFSEDSGVSWKKLSREYYHLGDTYWIDPFGCSSGFYNPRNYRMYFIGGKNSQGQHESNIVTGLLYNLAIKQII